MKKLLFVCLGNICRSPMAEGIFRDLLEKKGLSHLVKTDSAGTGGWHSGQAPDERAQETLRKHQIDISDLRARQIQSSDLNDFDFILCMDESNYQNVSKKALKPEHHKKIKKILEYDDLSLDLSVPDPYYGSHKAFDEVFEMLHRACHGFFEKELKQLLKETSHEQR